MITVRLVGQAQRDHAKRQVDAAPLGYVMRLSEPTRNLDQNAKLHAMIDDVARANPNGYGYDRDDWKAVFVNAWKGETRALYGLDGRPFPAPVRTSRFTVKQCAELIELIYAYGAEHGVQWSEK